MEFVILGQKLPKNHLSFLKNKDVKEIIEEGMTRVSKDRELCLSGLLDKYE